MFGVRRSFVIASNTALQRFKSVSIESIHIKAGVQIPDNKRLKYALQYVKGIGKARAGQIIAELNLENKLAKDLTKRELASLSEELSKYILGNELTTLVKKDISRLQEIECYRGLRHIDGLPCRGQRTKTNARTIKARHGR